MADVLALDVTYSSVQGRACPLPPWSTRPALSLLAALFSHTLM
jgi:hypothetical protein